MLASRKQPSPPGSFDASRSVSGDPPQQPLNHAVMRTAVERPNLPERIKLPNNCRTNARRTHRKVMLGPKLALLTKHSRSR